MDLPYHIPCTYSIHARLYFILGVIFGVIDAEIQSIQCDRMRLHAFQGTLPVDLISDNQMDIVCAHTSATTCTSSELLLL